MYEDYFDVVTIPGPEYFSILNLSAEHITILELSAHFHSHKHVGFLPIILQIVVIVADLPP